MLVLPKELNTKAWQDYLDYRKEQKLRKLRDMSIKRITNWLSCYEVETQADIIDTTIRNGWIGLFPPRDKKATYPQTNDGWLKLGKEKGIRPKNGESWPNFIGRVKEKI